MTEYFTPLGDLRFDTFNAAGTAQGPLMTVTRCQVKKPLDQIPSIAFSAPATDPKAAQIAAGWHVKVYHKVMGALGEFIVRTPHLSVTQQTIEFQGWSLMQELVTYNTWFNRNYNDIAVTTILSVNLISGSLYGLFYSTGWTPGTIDAGLGNLIIGFQGQSMIQALEALSKRLKCHFREGTSTRTIDFGVFGADSGFRLVAPPVGVSDLVSNTLAGIIESIDQVTDGGEIYNRIVPLGAGVGLSQLTLEKSTRSPTRSVGTNGDGSHYYYIEDAASQTSHGIIPKILPFWDITPLSNSSADTINAANALYDKAAAFLAWYKDDHYVYNVRARQVPAVKIGDKILLQYRGVINFQGSPYAWVDINAKFWVMNREDLFEGGDHVTHLTLSNLGRQSLDDASLVIGALEDIKVQQTFVQPYLGRESYVYYDEIDSTHTVTCPIDIDNGVLYVNSVRVRLNTRPLRSTVTGSASGGAQTSSAGGAQTSSAGGAQTSSASSSSTSDPSGDLSHTHEVNVPGNGQNGTTIWINTGALTKLSPSDSFFTNTRIIGTHTHGMAHTHTVGDHTHTVSNHTHTVADHTHGATYGIFDDSAYPDHIGITIDGTDRTAALGGPWATGGGDPNVVLDITTYIVEAGGGLHQNHSIVLSCTGGKGRIQVTVKTLLTTQAIAVV